MVAAANEELQKSQGLPWSSQILPGASSFARFGIKATLASQGSEHLLCCRGLVGALNPTNKKITPQGMPALRAQLWSSSGSTSPVDSAPGLEPLRECQKGLDSDPGLRHGVLEPVRAAKRGRDEEKDIRNNGSEKSREGHSQGQY